MRILVTGAAGFIGFHLAGRLLPEGRQVVGIDGLNGGAWTWGAVQIRGPSPGHLCKVKSRSISQSIVPLLHHPPPPREVKASKETL